MKKTPANIDHRIQLKKDEIVRHRFVCRNYPPDRREKYAIPYISKLEDELRDLLDEKRSYLKDK